MSGRTSLGGASTDPTAYDAARAVFLDGTPESFGPHDDRELAALLFGLLWFVPLFLSAVVLIAWGLFF